jgi:hypothetical protein
MGSTSDLPECAPAQLIEEHMQCSESHPKRQFGVSDYMFLGALKGIGLKIYRADDLSSSADNSAIAETSAAAQN